MGSDVVSGKIMRRVCVCVCVEAGLGAKCLGFVPQGWLGECE